MTNEQLFFKAVTEGNVEQTRFYLKEGVNPDYLGTYKQKRRVTPLCVSIDKGYTEITNLLIKNGATIDSL